MYKGVMVVLLATATGCASIRDLNLKWDEWVDENNSCEVDEDCALIYPGCPLDCYTAVSADAVGEAEEKVEDLIRRYERDGSSCTFDCSIAGEATCDAGVCEVERFVDTGV